MSNKVVANNVSISIEHEPGSAVFEHLAVLSELPTRVSCDDCGGPDAEFIEETGLTAKLNGTRARRITNSYESLQLSYGAIKTTCTELSAPTQASRNESPQSAQYSFRSGTACGYACVHNG